MEERRMNTRRPGPRDKRRRDQRRGSPKADLNAWIPKTQLGKKVQSGEITTLDQVFESNLPLLEPEIIDSLTDLEDMVVDVAKTARVVMAGRKFSFRVTVLAGNKNGYIGIGQAKDREKLAAIQKAVRKAKLGLVKIKRGCGSWECPCGSPHSIPFRVMGQNASVRITLLPAPKGVGLVAGENVKDVLQFAGIRDIWTKTRGNTRTKLNFVKATMDALQKINRMKLSKDVDRKLNARDVEHSTMEEMRE